jgi:hypothetical protein
MPDKTKIPTNIVKIRIMETRCEPSIVFLKGKVFNTIEAEFYICIYNVDRPENISIIK